MYSEKIFISRIAFNPRNILTVSINVCSSAEFVWVKIERLTKNSLNSEFMVPHSDHNIRWSYILIKFVDGENTFSFLHALDFKLHNWNIKKRKHFEMAKFSLWTRCIDGTKQELTKIRTLEFFIKPFVLQIHLKIL